MEFSPAPDFPAKLSAYEENDLVIISCDKKKEGERPGCYETRSRVHKSRRVEISYAASCGHDRQEL